MQSISDPGRPSRRDRRRAQKLIDTAFAEGRLTAAERALRTQRIDAAHTRGDIAMITRDLVAPAETNLGRALDAAGGTSRWHAGSGQRGTMSSMRVGSSARTSSTAGTPTARLPGTPTVDLSGIARRVRLIVIVAIGGFLLICLLGLVASIGAFFTGSEHDVSLAPSEQVTTAPGSSDPGEGDAANLHTAAGWTALVEAVQSESGTTEVYDLVAYPQYASVGLDAKNAVERRFYRDGAWQDAVAVRTPITGSLVDLAAIDAELIARLPEETAQHFGIDDPTETYIIVSSFNDDPQIAVYVQTDGESRYRTYRLDGTAKS